MVGMLRIVLVMAIVSGLALPVTASVAVTGAAGGRPLYVTNSGRDIVGSTGPHPVSAYTVGSTGAPVPLGEPVPTGAGARGIVFTPDGRHAYVVALEENAIYPYTIGDRGALAAHSPVPAGGESPFGIAISPDGRSLYFRQPALRNRVGLHDRRGRHAGRPGRTGQHRIPQPTQRRGQPERPIPIRQPRCPPRRGPGCPRHVPPKPDGTLDPVRPPTPTGAAGTGIAITPNGRFLYLACSTSDAVYAYRVGAEGELSPVPGSPFAAPKTPEGTAITPDGRHLYVTSVATRPVLSPDDQGIWTFAIGDDGALTTVGPRIAGVPGPGITSTPDGRRLYVSNFFSDTVSAFAITSSTGVLEKISGAPVLSGGKAPAFDAIGVLPNQGPLASFTTRARPAGQATAFNGTASLDPDGQIARYDWDFGDGTVLRDGRSRPTHVYRRPGSYRVTLTVTDNEGCSTTLVFTGRSALCHGSAAAHTTQLAIIPHMSHGQ